MEEEDAAAIKKVKDAESKIVCKPKGLYFIAELNGVARFTALNENQRSARTLRCRTSQSSAMLEKTRKEVKAPKPECITPVNACTESGEDDFDSEMPKKSKKVTVPKPESITPVNACTESNEDDFDSEMPKKKKKKDKQIMSVKSRKKKNKKQKDAESDRCKTELEFQEKEIETNDDNAYQRSREIAEEEKAALAVERQSLEAMKADLGLERVYMAAQKELMLRMALALNIILPEYKKP